MRNDSCRMCGGEQTVSEHCTVCEMPIEFHCKNCDNTTENQIHSACKEIDMYYQLLDTPTAI